MVTKAPKVQRRAGCASVPADVSTEGNAPGANVPGDDVPIDPIAMSQGRRNLVKGVIGVGVALSMPGVASAAKSDDPARQRPQDGDLLVFTKGPRKGEVIEVADVAASDQPVLAFPQDPATGTVRKGSRLNRVMLMRVDPARLTEKMKAQSVDGIVGYSAICTHGGCLVSMWREKDEALFCPCHYSRYDAWDSGAVKGGPAPRRLASLPLKLVDDQLLVAGNFDGKVGN